MEGNAGKPRELKEEVEKTQLPPDSTALGLLRAPLEEQRRAEVCICREDKGSALLLWRLQSEADGGAGMASDVAHGSNGFFPWGSLSPAFKVIKLRPHESPPLLKAN